MDQFTRPEAEVILDPPEYKTADPRYPFGA